MSSEHITQSTLPGPSLTNHEHLSSPVVMNILRKNDILVLLFDHLCSLGKLHCVKMIVLGLKDKLMLNVVVKRLIIWKEEKILKL